MASTIQKNYEIAKEQYAALGVDTDQVLRQLQDIPVSVHCWQIDDLTGFEGLGGPMSGGLAVTGNAPGKPTTPAEYVHNLDQALAMIPGRTKLALHAVYLDSQGEKIDRDQIEPKHFAGWVDYAKEHKLGLDFNPTYFNHPMADSGMTLASFDPAVRDFWVEHGKRCRRIGAYFGKELGQVCITNHWIPDGYKETTMDTLTPRLQLIQSLDRIFAEPIDPAYNLDSLESKLFGIGSESYVVGSHEFYSNYVLTHDGPILCMDTGHYHPTEVVSSKVSAYLAFNQELMLHVSRPVRWDSDHVVVLDDETRNLMREIVASKGLDRVHIGTDFFDGSLDRIQATILGARSVRKALLLALLQPQEKLAQMEHSGDFTGRLILNEELKALPFGLVWDMFCEQNNMPARQWG